MEADSAKRLRAGGATVKTIARALRRTERSVHLRFQRDKAAAKPNGHAAPPKPAPSPPAAPWPTPDGRMPPKTLWRTVARNLSNDDLGHLAREAIAERDRRIAKLTRQLETYKEAR